MLKPRHSKIFSEYNWRHVVLYLIPMTLVAMRVVIAGLLLIDASDGQTGPYFLPGFIFAWLTDVAEGFLARRWAVTSSFGAIIDGIADLILFGCVIFSIFYTHPAIIHSLSFLLIVGVLAQLVHEVIGIVKFHKIVSYDSSLAKIISVVAFLSVVEIFGFCHSYYLAVVGLVLWIISNLEGVTMTLILHNYTNNVPDIFAALKQNTT